MQRLFILLVAPALLLACFSSSEAADKQPASKVAVTVTRAGFTPARLTVKKGEAVTFVFTRKTDATCARDVVFPTSDTARVKKDLPLDEPVELTATYSRPGELSFACGMGHITGIIKVE